MGRWQIPLRTISPRDPNVQWDVGIPESLVRRLQKQGHAAAYARMMLVKESLDEPVSLFEGWSRPDKEDCYVYVGNPDDDYRSFSIKTPAPPNSLFLIFVFPDGAIDHWTWRARAPGSLYIPEDVKGKLLWQKA